MRASIATVSVHELMMFAVSKRDILIFISHLMRLPMPPLGERVNRVEITYHPSDPADKSNDTYDAEYRFYCGDRISDEKFNFMTSFTPPKGCSLDDSFKWLAAEAAGLAYAMSGGHVFIEDLDNMPKVTEDKTYTMTFVYARKER